MSSSDQHSRTASTRSKTESEDSQYEMEIRRSKDESETSRTRSEGDTSPDSRSVKSTDPRSTGSFSGTETDSRGSESTHSISSYTRTSNLSRTTPTYSTRTSPSRTSHSITSSTFSKLNPSSSSRGTSSAERRKNRTEEDSEEEPRNTTSSSRRSGSSMRRRYTRSEESDELDEDTEESGEEDEEDELEAEDLLKEASQESEKLIKKGGISRSGTGSRGSRIGSGSRGSRTRTSSRGSRTGSSSRGSRNMVPLLNDNDPDTLEGGRIADIEEDLEVSSRDQGVDGFRNANGLNKNSKVIGTDISKGEFADENREYFVSLPVGPTLVVPSKSDDPFLNGYNKAIDQVQDYIRDNIQKQEVEILKGLSTALGKPGASRSDPEVQAEFDKLLKIRATRRHFRGVLYDAIQQRKGLLESYQWRKIYEREKDDRESTRKRGLDWVFFVFLLFQALVLIAYNIMTDFANFRDITNQNTGKISADGTQFYVSEYYFTWTGMIFMGFLGFGLLATYTQRDNFTSLVLGILTAAIGFEWGLLVNFFFRYIKAGDEYVINLNMMDLIQGAYAAIAHILSFLIVMGTVNTGELIIMLIIEGVFYGLNFWIGWEVLKIYDLGILYTHIFGAFFGIGVAIKNFFSRTKNSPYDTLDSRYNADTIAIFGAVLLFITWPCFNAAFSPQGTQFQTIFNTVIALLSSCLLAFCLTRIVIGFKPLDIRNAMIGGGVFLGSVSALVIDSWVGGVLGIIGATIAFLGVLINNSLGSYTGIKDPVTVFWLMGGGGILGAIAGFLALLARKGQLIWGIPIDLIFWRHDDSQDIYQLIGIPISMSIGLVGGVFTGLLLLILKKWINSQDANYNDFRDFRVPSDFPDNFLKRVSAK